MFTPTDLLAINNRGVILAYATPYGTHSAVPALLVPVQLILRTTGALTPPPESSVYARSKSSAGTDHLGPLPIGEGRAERPGQAQSFAYEMVGSVSDIPGFTWSWERWIWYRSWIITRESTLLGASHRWHAGFREDGGTIDPYDKNDTDLLLRWDSVVPSATGRLYSTDATATLPLDYFAGIGDFGYREKTFRYSLRCHLQGLASSPVRMYLQQDLGFKKIASGSVVSAAYQSVINSLSEGKNDLVITKAKVLNLVVENKDVVIEPNSNPWKIAE